MCYNTRGWRRVAFITAPNKSRTTAGRSQNRYLFNLRNITDLKLLFWKKTCQRSKEITDEAQLWHENISDICFNVFVVDESDNKLSFKVSKFSTLLYLYWNPKVHTLSVNRKRSFGFLNISSTTNFDFFIKSKIRSMMMLCAGSAPCCLPAV